MKNLKYPLLIILVCILISACTLDSFMSGMGKNILGMVKVDLSSTKESIGSTGSTNEVKEKYPVISEIEEIIGGSTNMPEKILEPLSPEDADALAKAAQDPNDNQLGDLKDEKREWSSDEQQGIGGAIKVISQIFNIWDSAGNDVKQPEKYEGQTAVGDVFFTLQDNLKKIYESPAIATAGDVAALQYSLSVLGQVSKTIGDLGLTTSNGKEVKNLGDFMTAIDESTIDINDVMNKAENSDLINNLLGQVTTYVDVVGKCSNLTGGTNLSDFISGILSNTGSSSNNNENNQENTGNDNNSSEA